MSAAQRARRASLAAALVVASTLVAGGARAEVHETAERLATQWRAAGGSVTLAPPRFINEGETVSIDLPEGAAAACITVALVGARGISLHARTGDADEDADDAEHASQSVAGALTIERCGGSDFDRLIVTSDAGRGALETVVARSPASLPALRVVLPERTGGVIPPPPEAGELPALPAPAKRADAAEARARRDGASALPRETWIATNDGTGGGKIALAEGCHRIELFANDPGAVKNGAKHSRLDVDAELREDEDDRLLARDRSDAADARLEACVGEATQAKIVFAGSPANEGVVLAHVAWPIPDKLPLLWGNEARARMAEVLLARHVAGPRSDAIFLAQGGSGTTPVPVSMEPGGCYLAVVAVSQGTPRGIGIRAVVGARETLDDRSASDSAGAVSFCAGEARRALVEIEARGTSLGWALAVFRMRGGIWEAPR